MGVFHLKNALFSTAHDSNTAATRFISPTFTLKKETPLDDALQQMKATGERLAIVVDQNEKEIGVISLNDILRKIFTDIDL